MLLPSFSFAPNSSELAFNGDTVSVSTLLQVMYVHEDLTDDGIDNPTIKVSLYKKKERNGANQEYTEVKLSDYINESIESISSNETFISFKDGVEKNSYSFKFSLYDGDTFVGENSIKVVVR